ncbi:RHS repeat-associated core domain-containing protein, partial [Undibacterium sp. TS12]|uniref:RHS repeat-associated core domain-containing protein n=1 Tax=Undibacterium sp. TS12 TaxID=2908202 RepID=UPI002409146D
TIHANGIVQDYSYDDASQLTGITYKKADNSPIGDLTYGYDDGGRRTRKGGSLAKTDLPDTITTAGYDANNRLTTWGSQILSYDKNGNLTGDGINTYVWNARNQLIQIKDNTNTETASFTYDALGRRQTKTINGVSTGFVYDGVNIVQELNGLNTTQADTANIRASYVTAGVDQVLVQQSESGSTATSLTYLTDAIGSTIRLTNATGDKVVDYSYDPYGNTRADAVVNNAFQYTGRENDGNGLYYYRARYYSPATHQFIAEDPIGLAGGINGYGYVEGDPISTIDPYGLFGMDDIYGGIYNATNGWSPSQSNINAVVGFGDGAYKAATLGFGNLQDIRDFAGIEGDIDKCSSMYKGFNTAGNIAGGIAMVGPAGNILGRFFGPMKQWVRVGASYSKASGQHVAMSIRWGASPIGKGKYIQQIPSKMLQNFNQWLRAQKIPFSGWRGKDSGHFHLW